MRLLAPLLLLTCLALVPSAQAATVPIPGNPMTVYVNDVGNVTARHVRDDSNVFYPSQDNDTPNAGFTLGFPDAVGTIEAGTTYGPAGLDFTPGTQGTVTGSGTAASPFEVVTTYLASDAARVTQTVRHVSGQTRFSVHYAVENLSSLLPLRFRAGEYADLYLGGDIGAGIFDPGPPRFVGGRSPDGRVGGLEELPGSPWDHFEEDFFSTVRSNLADLTGPGLDDTVNPTVVDNGAAVQWDDRMSEPLPPRTTATFETAWTFQNIGRPTQLPPPPEPPEPPLDTSIDAQLARLPAPTIGKAVNVAPVKGEVYVKLAAASSVSAAQAKGRGFVPLRSARQIPVGSLLDTKKGVVRLVSAADARGAKQQADFSGGLFKTLQSRRGRGLTELRMSSGKFSGCRLRGKRSSLANAAARYRRRTVRRLRGNGRGRFRTRGRYSSATVRGTDWTVTDRCDGTLTRVKRGRVAVRDIRRKKTITLRAGKRYFAKAP